MTVKELRDRLAEHPDDFEVVMSSDAEGNEISRLADTSRGCYVASNTWSGELTDENEDDDGELCFVLWPTA